MFEQLVDSSSNKRNRTSPWAFALSLSIQILMLFSMILITMIQMEALPESMQLTFLATPPPPPPPPPPAAKVVRRVVRRVSQVQAGRVIAPRVIPKEIADIVEEDAPPEALGGVVGGVAGGVPGGQMGGVIGGVIGGIPSAAPPPPPVDPIRVSSGVQEAKRIRMVKPVFPPIARQARISGTVKLEAMISKDGTVQNLKVLSGHPLLSQAAILAVQQWRYAPTLLNGEPVPVITLIDIVFKMN